MNVLPIRVESWIETGCDQSLQHMILMLDGATEQDYSVRKGYNIGRMSDSGYNTGF